MGTTVRTRTRLIVALAAMAAMMFAMMPAAPASAGQLTVAVAGTANLSGGIPSCGSGSFTGTATGLDGTNPLLAAPVSANIQNYCNLDVVTGTADGTINLAGHACTFDWVRIGLVAVVTIGGSCHTTGTAVAAFAPNPVANPDGSINAVVAGAGVLDI